MWFGNVPTSMGTVAQTFTITEIWLHRRVFIVILDMTKLQKYLLYPEHTILYRGGFTSTPLIYYFVPLTKEDMHEEHLPDPFNLNMSHMP